MKKSPQPAWRLLADERPAAQAPRAPGPGDEYLRYAYDLFAQFDQGTRATRDKCRRNEAMWRGDHWDGMPPSGQAGDPRPVTPVLFSTVENLLSDLMDHYPEALLLGQEVGDDAVAEKMSAVVSYILLRRGFKSTYRDKCRQALKMGTSVLEVFWDESLYGGAGDVNIRRVDIRDFYWDPNAPDLQQGRACFKTSWKPLSYFKQRYPDKWQGIQTDWAGYAKADYDGLDPRDHAGDVLLLEHWYRVWDARKKRYVVHMGQMAGGVLLFWSEQDKALAAGGMYEHGMYPFIMEPLYPKEGEPTGMGVIDVFGDMQRYVDKLDQLMIRNILMSAQPKMLVNRNAELDPAALADWESAFIEGSRIDEGAVRWFQPQPLSPYTGQVQAQKIDRLERDSGQSAFNRGDVTGGVTAASGIIALQEAGNKRSRLLIDQLYDGFEKMVRMMIDLICENYTEARYIRINGQDAEPDAFARFNPGEVRIMGGHASWRDNALPYIEFDIQVHAQRETAATTAYLNELAAQMVAGGQLMPDEALSIMQFKEKKKVLGLVRKRMAQQDQVAMLQLEREQLLAQLAQAQRQIEQLGALAGAPAPAAGLTPAGGAGWAGDMPAGDVTALTGLGTAPAAGVMPAGSAGWAGDMPAGDATALTGLGTAPAAGVAPAEDAGWAAPAAGVMPAGGASWAGDMPAGDVTALTEVPGANDNR